MRSVISVSIQSCLAKALSNLSSTSSIEPLLFHQVKRYPLRGKSMRLKSIMACQKPLISHGGWSTRSFLSSIETQRFVWIQHFRVNKFLREIYKTTIKRFCPKKMLNGRFYQYYRHKKNSQNSALLLFHQPF